MSELREWVLSCGPSDRVRLIWDEDITDDGERRDWMLLVVREPDLSGFQIESGITTRIGDERDPAPFEWCERAVATALHAGGLTVLRGSGTQTSPVHPLSVRAISLN